MLQGFGTEGGVIVLEPQVKGQLAKRISRGKLLGAHDKLKVVFYLFERGGTRFFCVWAGDPRQALSGSQRLRSLSRTGHKPARGLRNNAGSLTVDLVDINYIN